MTVTLRQLGTITCHESGYITSKVAFKRSILHKKE